MRGDPTQLELGPALQTFVELLHELEVLDVAPLALPAARLPPFGPLVDGVHAKLAVRVEDGLGAARNERAARDEGGELHAVVGGVRLVPPALPFDLVADDIDGAPPAGPGVGFRGAVGENAFRGPVGVLGQDFLDREVLLAAGERAAGADGGDPRARRAGHDLLFAAQAALGRPTRVLLQCGVGDDERSAALKAGKGRHGRGVACRPHNANFLARSAVPYEPKERPS
jgi:hypothetical protein